MRTVICLSLSAAAGLLSPAHAHAQLKADFAEVVGVVIDEQAGRIPAATVSLISSEHGLIRLAASGPEGDFRFPLVPPSRYRLDVRAPGFTTRVTDAFDVRTGETVKFDVRLAVAGIDVTIGVNPLQPSPLNPERVSQASAITSEVLETFPIDRRNYLDFALLTPGVVETTTTTDQADFRVPIAPTSGLSFGGNNGRGNMFLIDGVSNNGATGNVRPSVPQEAVQEFQVNRNSYSAEYGGAIGGVVNIVTKGGSNTHRGTAFSLLRNSRFDARNYFDPEHSAFKRVQAGASLGGPIKRGRSFYFGTVERLDRRETVFVPVLQDPTVLTHLPTSQQRLLDALARTGDATLEGLASTLQHILTPTSNPLVEPLVASNSGSFPFKEDMTQMSLRLDHQLFPSHHLLARANLTVQDEKNSKFGALVGFSHGNETRWRDRTFVLADTYVLNSRWVGVTRLSFGRTRFEMLPNDGIGPEFLIGGFGSFGRDYLLPFVQRERYLEIQQALSYATMRHSVKIGLVLNPIRNEGKVDTFFGGRFVFGEVIPVGYLIGALAGNPDLPGILATQLSATVPALKESLDQPITALQAFSLGLPVAYVQAFGNSASYSGRQQHSAFGEYTFRPRPGVSLVAGVRTQYNDNTNLRAVTYVDPRIGVAWAPDGATVVRGGYGVFHSWVDLNIAYSANQLKRSDVTNVFVPLSGVPGVINPLTARSVTSADVYQYLLAAGVLGRRPVVLADLAPIGIDSRIPFPVTGGVQEDYTSPYSHQASMEVEHVVRGITLSAAYDYSRGMHLWRTRDQNLRQVGTRPDGQPLFGFVNPTLFNNFVIESAGRATYHGMVLQASRRLKGGLSAGAHYTLSSARDNVTDFNIDYASHNQLNPDAEWGPSLFNERHRFVARALFQTPDAPRESSPLRKTFAGWTLSGVGHAHSGRPFNVLAGYDNLGDGQVNTHRPLGVGRNIGRGPAFFGIDVRVTKVFHWSGGFAQQLELTAEAFNLLNRTNFLSVNNVVGAVGLGDLPQRLTGQRQNPVTPLAFTSAHNPRQLQFGMKLRF